MDAEIQRLLDEFGIPPPDQDLLDGDPPVPVDLEKLQAFKAGKLNTIEEHHVATLVVNYRRWYEAWLCVAESR